MAFKFDTDKAVNLLLFTIQSLGGKADMCRVLLMLYFADLDHLNRYGTLITGDSYIAMKNGPAAYNILSIYKQLSVEGIAKFATLNLKEYFSIDNGGIVANAKYNDDYLSASEVACLFQTLQLHKKSEYPVISALARDIAWQQANENGEISLLQLAQASKATDAQIAYILTSYENEIHSFNEDAEA